MQVKFRLPHHGVDRSAAVEDRAAPVVEEDPERRRHLLQGTYHVPELPREKTLHALIGVIGLIVHIIIKSTQQIVPHRTGIEVAVLVSPAPVEGAVPVQGQVPSLDIPDGLLPHIPDLPGSLFPLLVEEQGTVGKQGDIVAGRIKFLMDLLRQGRYGKSAGAFSGDQELVRLREECL